jgi:hypothetical protein
VVINIPAVWVSATYGSGEASGRPGDIRLAHYPKERVLCHERKLLAPAAAVCTSIITVLLHVLK